MQRLNSPDKKYLFQIGHRVTHLYCSSAGHHVRGGGELLHLPEERERRGHGPEFLPHGRSLHRQRFALFPLTALANCSPSDPICRHLRPPGADSTDSHVCLPQLFSSGLFLSPFLIWFAQPSVYQPQRPPGLFLRGHKIKSNHKCAQDRMIKSSPSDRDTVNLNLDYLCSFTSVQYHKSSL